ncbi:hypothetical protein [Alicyclobacillus acidiphilus]|uniref:hypothetical protein n=1 Tax=Alicyclobacillus acidiphilus TaxID=182455 RepID=UPI00082C3CA9|nr:hypothetical protein [Alicyclobacillus acidiphilus]
MEAFWLPAPEEDDVSFELDAEVPFPVDSLDELVVDVPVDPDPDPDSVPVVELDELPPAYSDPLLDPPLEPEPSSELPEELPDVSELDVLEPLEPELVDTGLNSGLGASAMVSFGDHTGSVVGTNATALLDVFDEALDEVFETVFVELSSEVIVAGLITCAEPVG